MTRFISQQYSWYKTWSRMFLNLDVWNSQRLAHNMSEIIWGRIRNVRVTKSEKCNAASKTTTGQAKLIKNRNVELSRNVPSVHLWVSSDDE